MKLAHADQTKIPRNRDRDRVTLSQGLQLHQVRCAIECGKHQSIANHREHNQDAAQVEGGLGRTASQVSSGFTDLLATPICQSW